MENVTYVLPSSRAIRDLHSQSKAQSLFLPNAITMSEFLTKLCIVKDYHYVDDDTRTLLLLQAANFAKFQDLQIERNFFTFTKNSSYIFKFFEELSAELYDLDMLDMYDIYAEYEEHIMILKQLYKNYNALCEDKKIVDKISLRNLYSINREYLQENPVIEIFIAGHLTNFELKLLEEATQYSQVYLHFQTTQFNEKMYTKLVALGFELQNNQNYKLLLNTKKVITSKPLVMQTKISCESLSEPLLQVAFVNKRVYDFVQKGYDPNRIALIVPDEKFASLLRTFDSLGNYNFAMGISYGLSEIYQQLNAAMQFLEVDSKENASRLQRVGRTIYDVISSHYYKNVDEVAIVELLESFESLIESKVERKIYKEELFSFERVAKYMQEMSVKSLLHLFMQRLSQRTVDDVRGGKITVMGVLESRCVTFDAVIIVDFSDANVPRKSDKDMFLNSAIREMANLPTMQDREALQKHYYQMLLHSAKEVAICYSSAASSSASLFLKQMHIEVHNIYKENDYASLLFTPSVLHAMNEEEIVLDYSFKNQKLSATKLKTFLNCKRKYYYKYICSISQHVIPKDMPQEWEIGVAIHAALRDIYRVKNKYESYEALKKDVDKALDSITKKNELEKYLLSLYKKKLQEFCVLEIERFSDGWHVMSCEENFSREFAGIEIVGQIDRVDARGDELLVLDYKTGSYQLYTEKNLHDATDFQLEFYYLLAGQEGKKVTCAYYDLKDIKVVPEAFLAEKLSILESNIKDMLMQESFTFAKCEDLKTCMYCEYAIMCQRA
jgi:RecB family exonuclease